MAKVDYTYQSNAHIQRVAKYLQMLERFFDDATSEFCKLFGKAKYDDSSQFFFEDYPTLKKKADSVVNSLSSSIYDVILTGTSAEWNKSNGVTDQMVRDLFKSRGVDIDAIKNSGVVDLFNNHDKALEAFQKRKIKGLSLSDKVWNMAEYHRLETQLALSIESGESAAELARKVKKCLKEPDKLFRRVRDKYGELKLSKNAKSYHPGAGAYRSSVRNAQRLARTEINMAYREAEMQRYQDLDFIVGFEVKRSTHPYPCDICESHKGKYPKDFKFNGWHPNCYLKDSEVLTAQGWKRLEDVSFSDEIISLNPYTREIENVCITAKQKYWYEGLMYRFFNKNLDCLVTPEHRMVYLNKSDGEIRYCQAQEYRKGKGAFYRSAENSAVDIDSMIVRGCSYDFDAFCEFMGYWLSDGSLEHDSGVSVSQNVGEKARECIVDCIKALGFTPKMREDRVMFYSSRFNAYLKQFGYSFTKFIPDEIKNASVRQIKIFLDAFIKCDGYERQSKSFVGSHGNVFVSENGERLYFTTSPRMAGDLCQCLLKVGHRPSVKVNEPKYSVKKDGSVIASQKPCYVISECSSSTATVFDKETIPYNDYVYDLTLERNHIMYIKRNGKCFWGSNCRCYVVPILNTQEEFDKQSDSILRGTQYARKSVNTVTAPPEGFNQWIFDNKARILRAKKIGTLPYYMKDNSVYINRALYPPKPKVVKSIEERMKETDWRTVQEMNDILFPVASNAWLDSDYDMRMSAFGYTLNESRYNVPMRRGDDDTDRIKLLTQYIAKQEVPTDVWVSRGTSIFRNMTGHDLSSATDEFIDSLIGMEMTDKAFVSTSVVKNGGFVESSDLIFRIFVPKGTKGAYCEPFSNFGLGNKDRWDGLQEITDFGTEAELLLQRDLKYKVTSWRRLPPSEWFPDGQVEITCYIIEN